MSGHLRDYNQKRECAPALDTSRPVTRIETAIMADKLLEAAFDEAMLGIYQRALSEVRYSASRFLHMLHEHRGLQTARILLHAATESEGYAALWRRGRLDLTVEALIHDNPMKGVDRICSNKTNSPLDSSRHFEELKTGSLRLAVGYGRTIDWPKGETGMNVKRKLSQLD
jgi:hypothetical protein